MPQTTLKFDSLAWRILKCNKYPESLRNLRL